VINTFDRTADSQLRSRPDAAMRQRRPAIVPMGAGCDEPDMVQPFLLCTRRDTPGLPAATT